MKIGLSLPWHYLAGIYDRDKASMTVFRDCSSAPEFLEKLKKNGCSSIELRHYKNDLEEKDLEKSFKNITDAGLNFSIHGDVGENHGDIDIYNAFPWLKAAEKGLQDSSGKELIITIHPLKKKGDADIELLKSKTENILLKYCNEIEKYSLPVKIAYENQRSKGFTDPAAVFTSISDSVTRIKRKELGTCWDMGHSYANFTEKAYEELPDTVFLENTIHTHIHDLSDSTGATHWPIIYGNVPIKKYTDLLGKYNYKGIFNLELSTERFSMLNVEEKILESMDILKGYLE